MLTSRAAAWALRVVFTAGTALAACVPATAPGEPQDNPEATLVCDRDYESTFRDLVDQSSSSLDILQWELLNGTATDEVIEVLGEAVTHGIDVRVLLDEEIEDNHDGVDRLLEHGVDARLDNNPSVRLHAKLVIADEERALVGSTNWSTASIDYNRECNLKLESSSSVRYLSSWIDRLWEDSSGRQTPDLEQDDTEKLRALVDDELMTHLIQRLDEATSRVDFTLYATYLQPTNPSAPAMQVFSAIASAASRGLAVRGIADWSDWNPDNNESNQDAVDWLEARGVDMRWEAPNVLTHAKSFRIDDGLQIQTGNLSTGGFANNHEAGAWTTEPTVQTDFDAWFESLWNEGHDLPPAR